MKTLLIPAKKKIQLKNIVQLKKLPRQIAIFYSIQYQELANQIKKELSSTHKINSFFQILGCSEPNISKNTKAILLLTDGKFHSICLQQNKIPVYIFNGFSLNKISEEQIASFQRKQKTSYLKYLHSDKIGILISTKPEQQNLAKALKFKKNSKKETYLFLSNNINAKEFENFPQIRSWINTACRRMDLDNSNVINIEQIKLL